MTRCLVCRRPTSTTKHAFCCSGSRDNPMSRVDGNRCFPGSLSTTPKADCLFTRRSGDDVSPPPRGGAARLLGVRQTVAVSAAVAEPCLNCVRGANRAVSAMAEANPQRKAPSRKSGADHEWPPADQHGEDAVMEGAPINGEPETQTIAVLLPEMHRRPRPR